VQEGLEGGRDAVPSRHGHKGGRRHASGRCGQGRWRLLQRDDHGGGVGLRHASALRQGRQGAGGGIAEGAQRREEGGEEAMHPLIGFALPQAEQASLDHLERRGLQGSEEEEQPLFGRRQGAGLLDGQLAGGPGCPIEAPRGPMRLERRLEGRNEGLKRVEGHAGAIQELRWVGPSVSEPSTRHRRCLLSLEIQQIINRDKL
jgi:hypothetical protein